MSTRAEIELLLARHSSGAGWLPLARAITKIENSPPWEIALPAPDRPVHTVGITGPSGVGKSTLTGRLIESYAATSARVAVLAVDPSSPITGGALLGDRLRMEPSLLGRAEVFVRSLASRGSYGAIASSTRAVARLLELSGSFDVILIETVGAGQTEVAIAELADTVVLVTVPGLGDAVQVIKAGLMEVADQIVLNMADRPGVPETLRHFRVALGRTVPIATTVATEGTGVDKLRERLDVRWASLCENGELAALRAHKHARESALIAEAWTSAIAGELTAEGDDLHTAVKRILEEAARRWSL